MFKASIDVVMQSLVVGWAAKDGLPTPLTLSAADWTVDTKPNMHREDLAAAGLPVAAGFTITLPEPLSLDDELHVRFADGSMVSGSPFSMHKPRLRQLLDGIDLSRPGLEFGPLDRPVLGKRGADVYYVDHASRDDLLKKYLATGTTETIDPDRVATVDVIWPGGSLAGCVPEGSLFDYAIASHVIEHVPDMIGWLKEIAIVLKPNGLLNLAVPDKNATFDRFRQTTTLATFVASHVEGRVRPSAQQVFDHIAFAAPIGAPASLDLDGALAHAWHIVRSNDYVDVHCQVFTAESFVLVMEQIAAMDLLPFRMRKLFPTRPGENEFIVSFEKCDDFTAAERAASFAKALG